MEISPIILEVSVTTVCTFSMIFSWYSLVTAAVVLNLNLLTSSFILLHTISIETHAKSWICSYERYKKKYGSAKSDKQKMQILNEMFLKLSKSTNVVDGERVLNDQQYMKFQKTIENHKQEV